MTKKEVKEKNRLTELTNRRHAAILHSVKESGYYFTTKQDKELWNDEMAKYIVFSGKRPYRFERQGVSYRHLKTFGGSSKHVPFKSYIKAKIALFESRYLTA